MRRNTVPLIRGSKRSQGADPLVVVTAYDASSARVAAESAVDLILVGDSLGMVLLGYTDTRSVTMEDMLHHVRAVGRTKPEALIVADMPWMSFQLTRRDTVLNAAALVHAGADCVKVEGGDTDTLHMVESLVQAHIPVIGHVGLTPQSSVEFGGFKVQARSVDAAQQILEEAQALEQAGCFSLVIEGVPNVVGKLLTDSLEIPTIGIGAGADTDGQVLVFHDVVGLEDRFKPKFVRKFGDSFEQQCAAIRDYSEAVKDGTFPSVEEQYGASAELTDAVQLLSTKVDEK